MTRFREPSVVAIAYACPTCNTMFKYEEDVEAGPCYEDGCGTTLCTNCAVTCQGCDKEFCSKHIESVDYGTGLEKYCAPCRKVSDDQVDQCDGCGKRRVDLAEVESEDRLTGYRETDRFCPECRGRK